MSYSRDPLKYPAQFFTLVERALAQGELYIPHPSARSFRGHLQTFFSRLEASQHPLAEQVKGLMVRLPQDPERKGKGVIICDRDKSPDALAVSAALGIQPPSTSASEAQAGFLKSLSLPSTKEDIF